MSTKCSIPESFTSYRNTVRIELKKIIDNYPSDLGNILRYHMGYQDEHGHSCKRELGKFIRPILCLLSCQAVGGDTLQVIPAAAAVELVHNFSLIHDDIEDASDETPIASAVGGLVRLWGPIERHLRPAHRIK